MTPDEEDYRREPWNSDVHVNMSLRVWLVDGPLIRIFGGTSRHRHLDFFFRPAGPLVVRWYMSGAATSDYILRLPPGSWNRLRISYLDRAGAIQNWVVTE